MRYLLHCVFVDLLEYIILLNWAIINDCHGNQSWEGELQKLIILVGLDFLKLLDK